jgi:hypothetical protein
MVTQIMQRAAGAQQVIILALALTAWLAPNACAFGGEVWLVTLDEGMSRPVFPMGAMPDASVQAIATSAYEIPAIDASHFVTLSPEELATIAGMGVMPEVPGTPTTGVVLWDERPQAPAVVGTNLSSGQRNHQTIGVMIQGY